MHALRTSTHAISLARLGSKYGVRVPEELEQQAFELLRPQHQFVKVRVVAKFKAHPLPFGFQRQAMLQLLQQWKWAAKPIQPIKSDASGAAWEIGAAEEPPALALPFGNSFVLISKLKDASSKPEPPAVCASRRTRKHIEEEEPAMPHGPVDPWTTGQDPWAAYKQDLGARGSASSTATAAPVAVQSKLDQLQTDLKQQVPQLVQDFLQANAPQESSAVSAQDERIRKMEVEVRELKQHNVKFEGWFQTLGKQVSDNSTQLKGFQQDLQQQRTEIGQVSAQLTSQFANQMQQIEALLAKRSRTE